MAEDYLKRLGLVELQQHDEDVDYLNQSSYQNDLVETSKKASRRKTSKVVKKDDEGKKAGRRGRPRVDAPDESAVERRRTQIRLAQRAYRERKETTIADLDKQVLQLQETISDMSQMLLEFHGKATTAGMMEWNPTLGQEMRSLAHHFSNLSHRPNNDREQMEGAPKRKRAKNETSIADEFEHADASPTKEIRPTSQPSSEDSVESKPKAIDMLGYQMCESSSSNSDQDSLDSFGNASRSLDPQSLQTGWRETNSFELQQYRAELPEAPSYTEEWSQWVDRPLKPLYTYNFQETSFARRLLRYTYEKTYHFLTNPMTNPDDVSRLLRYSLCLGSVQSIAEGIKERLMKPAGESLEQWGAPELHIGGAGLHYPREAVDGTVRPIQGYEMYRNFGPWPYHRAERRSELPWSEYPEGLSKFAEVEGIWFDTYDVEQYLKSKGLYLDGQSSTAIVELDDDTPPLSSEASYGSPLSSSGESFSATESTTPINEQTQNFFDVSIDGMLTSMDLMQDQSFESMIVDATLPQGDFSSNKNPISHMLPTNLAPAMGQHVVASEAPKKKVMIDVDMLLEALHRKAVCLGRAPGFRMEDVDAAVGIVLQEAW